jgi:TonB family protein
MKEKKNSRFALIFSILLHLLILLILVIQEKKKQEIADQAVEVKWVDLQTLEEMQLDKKAQIVQQDDKSVNEAIPEKDYKLSKNNQDVLKETKAAKNGAFQNRKNQVEAPKTKPTPKVAVSPKQKVLNSLKPSMFDSQYSAAKIAPPPKPALTGAEVSQNDDYLKDVVAGAETLLKTREFVYYSYYNRIKRKLRQHWEPRIKKKIVKILRKGRRIASTNDKITRLVITLDENGELKRIQVKNASGYNDLDDAAIEAFRAAAPFPNPPQGIISKSREVEIPWDFVLET